MKKYLISISCCFLLALCALLDAPSDVVTDFVNPRQAEVAINIVDIARPAMP